MITAAGGGRIARLRLERRLATAAHALDLLDRKERALVAQLQRLELLVQRTEVEWAARCTEAIRWLRRASALDGRSGLLAAVSPTSAMVAVDWRDEMGVRFPVAPRCQMPEPRATAGSSALARTGPAHAVAVEAAARHAAAMRAVAVLSAEVDKTRRLRRALDAHVMPRLTEALRVVVGRLEESEREENMQVRWAAGLVGLPSGGEWVG